MDCTAFRNWLDEGFPSGEAHPAREHMRGCKTCARQFEAARSLDWALGQRIATVSKGFTDRVMSALPEHQPQPAYSHFVSPPLLQLVKAGIFNLNVVAATALLLIPWLTGIENWRRGVLALPYVGEKMIDFGLGGPAINLPPLSYLPTTLPLLTLPFAALAVYLLYRIGEAAGNYLSSLAN